MEPQFSALRVIQKKDGLDFAAFLRKNMTGFRKFLKIFLFVITPIALPACIFEKDNTGNLITILLLIPFLLFFDRLHGLRFYRTESRGGAVIELNFYDDSLQSVSQITTTTFLYTGIVAIHETQHQFLLEFPSKRYLLVPKSALPVGRVDEFRDFITQRCKKPCRPCQIRSTWRWIWLGIFGALLLVSLIGSYHLRHRSQAFVCDNYSITLPSEFVEIPSTENPPI